MNNILCFYSFQKKKCTDRHCLPITAMPICPLYKIYLSETMDYFTTTFLPLIMFNPFCGALSFMPWRL